MTRRVLIISDHPAIGRGLRALLETMVEVEIVSVIAGNAGLDEALTGAPDVVLVEVEQARGQYGSVIGMLRGRLPNVRIVAFGIYPGQETAARRAGADAFLIPDDGESALRTAILGDGDADVSEP
jgi:DNA-binding NarL/FixJ family response regulator